MSVKKIGKAAKTVPSKAKGTPTFGWTAAGKFFQHEEIFRVFQRKAKYSIASSKEMFEILKRIRRPTQD